LDAPKKLKQADPQVKPGSPIMGEKKSCSAFLRTIEIGKAKRRFELAAKADPMRPCRSVLAIARGSVLE
jgi:hypothetical protein